MNFSQRKIICVSLNRSGSTFFVSTLANLPKIAGDYEIQVVDDVPTSSHLSLQSNSLENIYKKIKSNKTNLDFLVSKIVLAPQHKFKPEQVLSLLKRELSTVDSVIIILRSWYEQFFSKYLGGGHFSESKSKLPEKLREFYSEKDIFENRFKLRKKVLNINECVDDLKKREFIQTKILKGISSLPNTTFVEYKDLSKYIFKFISQNTNLEKNMIKEYIINSPTKKLISPKDSDIFTNIEEINKIKFEWQNKYEENINTIKNFSKFYFK